MARYFPKRLTPESISEAPAPTFNQKDTDWLQTFGDDLSHPTHWLPSTQSFVQASLSGMGWG